MGVGKSQRGETNYPFLELLIFRNRGFLLKFFAAK